MDIGRLVSLTIRLPDEHDVIPMPVHALYENQTIIRFEESRLPGRKPLFFKHQHKPVGLALDGLVEHDHGAIIVGVSKRIRAGHEAKASLLDLLSCKGLYDAM